MIRFENVTKTFITENRTVTAVKDVNLDIKKGQIYGIIGFSGAGKSTLVRCINLLERPTSGKVYIDSREITALKEKELRKERKKIGMIFQQFNLFASRTVKENVAYPLKGSGLSKKEINEKVDKLLKLVELDDKKKAYPSMLSGGQKQRVAIARALALDPQVLLSDESTSALDPQTTASILKLLKELNKKLNLTIVMITHEMQVVKEICDCVAVMENGSVVEEGDVFELFVNPKQKITKNFAESTSNLSKIQNYIDRDEEITRLKKGECILKFKYIAKNASEPLVSYLSREYGLDINIIFGNIDFIGDSPAGGLVSVVSGKKEKIDEAIEYLKNKNVSVEVILDARAD